MNIIECLLQTCQPLVGVWHDLCGRAGLRNAWFSIGERVPMDESMSRGAALDLAQPNQVTLFEVAIPVFEFPQSGLGGASVEDITNFVKTIHVKLSHEGGDVRVFEVLR